MTSHGDSERQGEQDEPAPVDRYDEHHPPPYDFDAWARISARLVRRNADQRLTVLDDEQIEPDDWDAIDLYWVTVLAGEVGRSDLDRARRYSRACTTELASRAPDPGHSGSGFATTSPAGSVDETAIVSALSEASPLPFVQRGAPHVPPPNEQTGLDLRGETAALGAIDVEGEPLPFVASMSLKHYAAMCAKLALYPARVDPIRTQYGLSDDDELASIHASFRRRFANDPALAARFQELETYYRAHWSGTVDTPSD